MFNKIQRPVLSIVISLIIVFFRGIIGDELTHTQFPSISPPMVNVTADYPGSNGELMIKVGYNSFRRALNGVPGMKYMTSDAGNDGDEYQVVFNLGTDPNQAAINVQKSCSFSR
jgi:HAE1 family hydrophobic/amphiphilic exporter-1